ncbi:MAG: type I methionyl aminopeptidase [Patescibacteria group bacterium]|nr:type I methionyl aminopeptidase [Patescibacteria group bacterium]
MVIIKTTKEIEIIREGGKILAEVINTLVKKSKPGISTLELDKIADKLMHEKGGQPSFKGYQGFPAAICASLNDEVVHGIPSEDKILKEGDIFSIDAGMQYKGLYTDMSRTINIGRTSKKAKRLVNTTKKALELGLRQIRAGNQIGDISFAIQDYAESNGFGVVRSLVGHGVGKKVHEEPKIPNYGEKATGPILEEGMVLAIEPMLTAGNYEVSIDEDGWTARTKDGLLSAHFEDTVAVTKNGYSLLTK